ncbi:MAG: diguanylate cyclase domain-containing protein [Rhizobiaceae bacterium]
MLSELSTIWDMILAGHWPAIAVAIAVTLGGLGLIRYRLLYLVAHEENRNSRELIENLSEGIYRSTLDGGILSANPALANLNGCDSPAELLGMVNDIAGQWYVDPNRRSQFRRILMREGQIKDFVSEVYRYKTRERIWVVESARLVRDPTTNRPLYYEGSVREITETVKRLNLEEFYQKLISQVPGGLFQIERKANGAFAMTFVSPGFVKIVGMEDQVLLDRTNALFEMIAPADRGDFLASLNKSARENARWDCEFSAVVPNGTQKWLRVTATPEKADGRTIWHGYLTDCSLRKKHEIEIEKLAFKDPLTDLPNRRMLLERLRNANRKCLRHGRHGALLFLDLDNFKEINDSHGHHVGDALLQNVARRLEESTGRREVVSRMGGDEFVVLVEDAGRERADAAQKSLMLASRLLAALREPYVIGETSHSASASIGIVVFDGSEESSDEILKKADVAMYGIKGTGRDGLALFDAEKDAMAAALPTTRKRQAEDETVRRLSA